MIGRDRAAEARARPILEVAAQLDLQGLRRDGREHVGPCPECGGAGRREVNRFAINPDRQVWSCRRCATGGGVVDLVMHARRCCFRDALDFILGDEAAPIDPAELKRRRHRIEAAERQRREVEQTQRARAIRQARDLWARSVPAAGTPVEEYLAGRGIHFPSWPPTLRFLPDHPARKVIGGELVELHRGPCMIAAIQDAAGRVRAVHQTWIDPRTPGEKARLFLPDGAPAPAKMVRGSKKGGAIRLSPAGASGVMVTGEGIETTASLLAAGLFRGATFWAAVDLGNIAGRMVKRPGVRWSGEPDLEDREAWVPPKYVSRLILLQDGDSAAAATRAKLTSGARRAMLARPGLSAEILSADAGKDFNDMWREGLLDDE